MAPKYILGLSAFFGFYDKPLLKFERITETYLGVAPRGFGSIRMAGPLWMKEKLFYGTRHPPPARWLRGRGAVRGAPRVA